MAITHTHREALKMKEKTKAGIIILIVLFEILILICGVFSDNYMIKETSVRFSGISISSADDKIKEFIDLGINLLVGFLSIKQIGTVSAAVGDAAYCCLETRTNGICVNYPSSDEATANCGNDYYNHACSQFSESNSPCDEGYCYDERYGTCTSRSVRFRCEEQGGKFSVSIIEECQYGGCILGSNCHFETEKQCELRGGNWDSTLSDPECAAYSLSRVEGACVYADSDCDIITEQECAKNKGVFYRGYLCSHPALGTICEKQNSIRCVEGRDEIFWIDSCGNVENIYSSDRDDSWNDGFILNKEDSCGNDEGNAGSVNCGNCLSPMSMCSATNPGRGVKDGDFICQNLGCKSSELTRGYDRINGETWCVYEGSLEDGKAVVGSEHWLFSCINGQVVLQDHSNKRERICMEHTITENSKSFTTASLVANNHENCIYINDEYSDDPETLEEKCNEDYSCYIKNINVDDNFRFSMCMPKYPKGTELKDESGNDENFCGEIGSLSCVVYYEKDWKGNWDCLENCHCEKGEFAKDMQDFCINLGDCGSYVNYVGQGSDNIKIVGRESGDAPAEIPWTSYKGYANTNPNEFIDSKDAEEYFLELMRNIIGGADWDELQGGEKYALWTDRMMKISGAAGLLVKGLIALKVIPSAVNFYATYTGSYGVQQLGMGTVNIGAFGAAVAGFAIGAFLGNYLAKKLGRTGPAATTMTLSAGVAGAVIAYAIYAGSAAAVYPVGTALAIIAAIVLLFVWLSGWGKTEERYVDFTCRAWQAPTEDYDCNDCNDNLLMPCTKYRCEALGQKCHLLNNRQEEENPICISLPAESNPPVLKLTGISEGYDFSDFEDKRAEIFSDSGGCVQELTEVRIDFTTDEFAQCKWSFEKSSNYNDMEENYPNNGNSFALNHSLLINFPPLEDLLDNYEIQGDIREWYGDATIYLRCQDAQDPPNFNFNEYMIKFCINTEPDRTAINHGLTQTEPESGASLKYGATAQYATFFLNKPAECRYSTQSGVAYNDMTNIMSCNTNIINGRRLKGWPCTTTFNNLVAGKNKFYIKCKAQPWLVGTDQESERAINVEDYEYTLHVSENELKISSVLPQGEISTGFEPISVELRVTTLGGINKGVSTCSYLWGNHWVPFQNTDSATHTQSGWTVEGGNHLVRVLCEDSANNMASDEISFKVYVDNIPPKVVRAYHEGGSLKIITDEEARCYYDLNGCNFKLENATQMDSGFSTMHITTWNPSLTYYIKCKDAREMTNSDCAIKIIPGS